MDKLIPEPIAKQVQEVFAGLAGPVEILFFTSQQDCPVCPEVQQLLGEVAGLSDLLTLQVFDLHQDAALAQQYSVTEAPSFVLAARVDGALKDYGVRFLGMPSGHEFSSLIHDLVLVSKGDSGLSQPTREFLHSLTQPVLLQVFTTPT